MADEPREPSQSPKWPLWVFLSTLLATTLLRLFLARMAKHPGPADYSFYFTVARNLAQGRGPVLDVVGQFLNDPQSLPCYAHDYWMPLASWIMSVFLRAGGDSLFVALIPSMMCGLALGGLSIIAGRLVSDSWAVGFCAGAIVLVLPPLLMYSLVTDGAIYYACWIGAGLLALMMARQSACPRALDAPVSEQADARPPSGAAALGWILAAAFFGGLGHLTRQDGCLFLIVVLMCVLRMPWSRARRAWVCGAVAAVHAMVLLPWLVSNLQYTGQLLPSGSARTAFLTDYEDLYVSRTPIHLSSFLDWGIANILWSKLRVGLSHIRVFHELLGELVCVLVVMSLAEWGFRRKARMRLRTVHHVLLFGLILYLFYTLIATIPSEQGAFLRSAMALLPFLVVLAVDALWRLLRRSGAFVGLVILTILFGLGRGVVFTNSMFFIPRMIVEHGRDGDDFRAAGRLAKADLEGLVPAPVIMARDPWAVHASTGIPAVQIPNEDLDTILATAARFHVTHLLLPAPRSSLTGIHDRTSVDPRIVWVGEGSRRQWSLWRLNPEAGPFAPAP
ncbi:MAG: hypothetical protein IT449_05865 [Phycisphaerales bacterium]|nr:hypothetical protein [Phycisphaerales bacterium]